MRKFQRTKEDFIYYILFTAEQLTLGMMIHLEGLPIEILPAYLHWLCEFKPLWNPQKQVFVEPFLPHETIGILHLSGFDQMRVDRSDTTDFQTTDGGNDDDDDDDDNGC